MRDDDAAFLMERFYRALASGATVDAALRQARRDAVSVALGDVDDKAVIAQGRVYLDTLARYEDDAVEAGPNFVEIQNTMLFATLGERTSVAMDPVPRPSSHVPRPLSLVLCTDHPRSPILPPCRTACFPETSRRCN